MDFIKYSDIGFEAFQFTDKKPEVIARKKDIIDSVFAHYGVRPVSYLCVGFNPAMLAWTGQDVTVTKVSEQCLAQLQVLMPNIKHVPWEHLITDGDRFDVVVAMDEFLAFADSEDSQHRTLDQICGMTRQLAITTLKDYKNQGFKDREFSIPSVIRNEESTRIYVEYNDYELHDRNAWIRDVYQIENGACTAYQGFQCRQMFFKQCAKFSIDAGAKEFLVHKNIMYKSLIKKNYEHVISIKFGSNGHNNTPRYHSQ